MTSMAEDPAPPGGYDPNMRAPRRMHVVNASGAFTNPLLYGGGGKLLGWSVSAAPGATSGQWELRDGSGADGLVIAVFNPVNPEERTQWLGPHGVAFATSLVANKPASMANAPTGLTATPVVGGGTFVAGNYFWKVTFTTASGETTGSNEATAAIALNGSANLAWNAPPVGVTGVKVYRGTAVGAENALIATLGPVAVFVDTGTAGVGGNPPATNTATIPDIGAIYIDV